MMTFRHPMANGARPGPGTGHTLQPGRAEHAPETPRYNCDSIESAEPKPPKPECGHSHGGVWRHTVPYGAIRHHTVRVDPQGHNAADPYLGHNGGASAALRWPVPRPGRRSPPARALKSPALQAGQAGQAPWADAAGRGRTLGPLLGVITNRGPTRAAAGHAAVTALSNDVFSEGLRGLRGLRGSTARTAAPSPAAFWPGHAPRRRDSSPGPASVRKRVQLQWISVRAHGAPSAAMPSVRSAASPRHAP